jgi:hypothetical protein
LHAETGHVLVPLLVVGGIDKDFVENLVQTGHDVGLQNWCRFDLAH